MNLSQKRQEPSERLRLLAALYPIFATREHITSAELIDPADRRSGRGMG